MLSGKTFLITGATGRLGCDLTARLEELGASVHPIILEGYPIRPKLVPWIAESQPLEVRDKEALDALPRPDYAINLHWKVDRSRPFAEQIVNQLDWNVHRLEFVWQWLKDQSVEHFVNCSTIRVFSPLNDNPISSRTEPHPTTPYGIAKLAAEKFFAAFFSDSSTTVAHLRLCSVCSFGEHPSQLMSQLASSALDGARIRVNTGHSANLMYIDEAVDIIINAALLGNPDRRLAVTPSRSIDEIAKLFEGISGTALNAEYIDLVRGAIDPEFISDIDTLRADWVRVTPLHEAITRILQRWSGVLPVPQ